MEVFSYKACKALFLVVVVKKVEAEIVEHCIDTQSSCLGSRVQTSPTCLPANVLWQLLMGINMPSAKLTPIV